MGKFGIINGRLSHKSRRTGEGMESEPAQIKSKVCKL